MVMTAGVALLRLRQAAAIGVVCVVWVLAGMVYLDRFPASLKFLQLWLMPWKRLQYIPQFTAVDERLAFMQGLLDASDSVADMAFVIMTASFVALTVYATFNYQQRRRRIRENELLTIKNQEIARRNEFIRYISATIGHEFKNNVGRIKRRLDLMADLDPDFRHRLDQNLTKLFADIDIFKKISDAREDALTDFVRVDLKRLVQDVAGHYADMAKVSYENGGEIPPIFASPTMLRTVFENLMDNSVKYRKPEQEKAVIAVSFSHDMDGTKHYAVVTFRDEGIGMDEVLADECFYKVMESEEGWGQGLYFVKYVVGLHAGRARVGKEYTSPGRGTEIIIRLPLVEEELGV